MKTAISIPDRLFREADRFARRIKKSRSRFYSDAAKEYLARHAPDAVTESLNNACVGLENGGDPFAQMASHKILKNTLW